MREERCCGNCCWFKYQDASGYGSCVREWPDFVTKCDEECPIGRFVSESTMRHHIAVLIQANRYRRDPHVPGRYKMPDPVEFGRAIDFAVKYMKTFGKL
jgi:hypothetical protein